MEDGAIAPAVLLSSILYPLSSILASHIGAFGDLAVKKSFMAFELNPVCVNTQDRPVHAPKCAIMRD